MASPRVLVVDDDPFVLKVVAHALSGQGYEVQAVIHPLLALELVKRTSCFDLVVTDFCMPEMDGSELVRRIAPLCPRAAVVLMSGYIVDGALPQKARFLPKPFRIKELYAAVANALGQGQ